MIRLISTFPSFLLWNSNSLYSQVNDFKYTSKTLSEQENIKQLKEKRKDDLAKIIKSSRVMEINLPIEQFSFYEFKNHIF